MSKGVMFHLSGLADTAVKESRDRIVAALKNNGIRIPVSEITINMAPADLRKEAVRMTFPSQSAFLPPWAMSSPRLFRSICSSASLALTANPASARRFTDSNPCAEGGI